MQEVIDKARVLIEALPYIKEFRGRTVVIKVGGAALSNLELRRRLAEDIILLDWVGIRVVVVHGGGKQISRMLDRVGIEPNFVDGIRVTDEATLEVVEMVLGGTLNKELVRLVGRLGGTAVGITGKDGGLATAQKVDASRGLQFVGEVVAWDTRVLEELAGSFIPIIAPLAVSADGDTLNINADPFASGLAEALGAEKLVLLTDVEGVRGSDGVLISSLSARGARDLIDSGVIEGGMIPKVENALAAVDSGVGKVHIIDGRIEHALLLEIFTAEGIGTQFLKEDRAT